MRFQVLSVFTTVLAASSAVAQLSSNAVVDAIKKITDLSDTTADVAESITSPTKALTNGLKLVVNFRDIVSTATTTAPKLKKPENAYTEAAQTDICEAFREFVRVHQRLLNIVIGEDSLLARLPVASLLAAALRALESIVDKLAFGIIDLVPTCAAGAKSDLAKLDSTIANAIKAYS